MRITLLSLFAIGLLSGCDIVDMPRGGADGPTLPGDDSVTRNVLLEDCTGHLCNNCPEAAEIAQGLKDVYGDRLVVVGVHMVESFAGPVSPDYTTDFRTPAGNAYEQTFQISALPMGLISRKPFNNSIRVSRGNWSSAVAQLINTPANMDIWIDPLTYDNNIVSGTVKVAILNTITSPQNLTIYLTEDHVIDWQLNNQATPPDVPDYDHRHVLRSALNSPWGESLITGGAQVGDTLTTTFSYPMPANVLVPDNCALVAYVYSTSGGDQYEVKQVVERKFVP